MLRSLNFSFNGDLGFFITNIKFGNRIQLMLNSGGKNILTFVLSENQIKNYEDGICGSEPAI
jgi:hypothetical protein